MKKKMTKEARAFLRELAEVKRENEELKNERDCKSGTIEQCKCFEEKGFYCYRHTDFYREQLQDQINKVPESCLDIQEFLLNNSCGDLVISAYMKERIYVSEIIEKYTRHTFNKQEQELRFNKDLIQAKHLLVGLKEQKIDELNAKLDYLAKDCVKQEQKIKELEEENESAKVYIQESGVKDITGERDSLTTYIHNLLLSYDGLNALLSEDRLKKIAVEWVILHYDNTRGTENNYNLLVKAIKGE